ERNTRQRLGGAVRKLVQFAAAGDIEVHTTIDLKMEDLNESNLVASGGAAKVYKVMLHGKPVAVKKFHESSVEFGGLREIRREIAIMRFACTSIQLTISQPASTPQSCHIPGSQIK